MKRVVFPFTVLLLVVLACGSATPVVTPSTVSPVATNTANLQFTIAVEYAILGLAQDYAAAGATYAKLQDAFVIWGNIEPKPGQYQWGPLDALVMEYQQAGFTGLQMDLAALSPWASSQQPSLGNQGDTFPQEQYLDDYAAYVTAVVERYDGDGVDDMPGLLYPIHDYGIEREFTGYWPGSADEYVRLLRIAYPAIKAADPDANVLLVALLMADVFDGNPDQAETNHRLAQTPSFRKSLADIQTILAVCDSYDIVDFHSLADYTEIPPTTAWIREELVKNGCGEKPIWIGDAFPMSGLIGFGGFVPPIPFAPTTLETRDAIVELLQAVADPSVPEHATAQAWLYAETARGLVRKIVVSAGERLLGINIGNLEDWKTGTPAIDKPVVPMLGTSMFMGMTDTTITNKKPGGDLPITGQQWAKARRASNPRPVYYALKLLTEKIGYFTLVEKTDLGAGIWAYRFETPTSPVWVLWYDDCELYLPGQTPPSVTVQLPFPASSATLTWTPTEIGQSQPETLTLDASDGMLALTVTATPVFVQPVP